MILWSLVLWSNKCHETRANGIQKHKMHSVRFPHGCLKILNKKTKRPHLQIKSNSSSLLLRKRSLVEFGTMSDFLPDDQYELTNQDRGRKKIKQKLENRKQKKRKQKTEEQENKKRMINLNRAIKIEGGRKGWWSDPFNALPIAAAMGENAERKIKKL